MTIDKIHPHSDEALLMKLRATRDFLEDQVRMLNKRISKLEERLEVDS